MDIINSIFQHKKAIPQQLSIYGFSHHKDTYFYQTMLTDSGFEMQVHIKTNGNISATVIDPASNEPYTLHLTENATGSFIHNVQSEYISILQDIANKCFEPDVFQCRQTQKLIEYVRNKYGDEPEYLWKKFSNNAVWRRKDTGKWYGALLSISTSKLGLTPSKAAEIIDLRIQPENMENLIDHKLYFPGWHMNKKHWYTMILDESITFEELCQRIDESYNLATK